MSGELPRGWREVPLLEIADSCLGKMLDRQKHTKGTALPYLRNVNVRWSAVDTNDLLTMQFEPSELERYGLRAGDVLVCEGGEPGRAAVWDGRIPGLKFQKAIHRVRPHGRLLPEWLVFRLRDAAQSGTLNAYFTGTTIKHLTGTSLAKFTVPLPPLNEQRRIVAKLDALQARSRRAREALDAIPPLLEKLRQSILAAAFRGDLTRDWRAKNPNVEPASELLKRIRVERRAKWEEAELAKMIAKGKPPKDDKWKAKYEEPKPVDASGLPELPEGWCWASLDELTLLAGGITKGQKRVGGEITRPTPYLRVANVQRGYLDLEEVREIEASEADLVDLRLVPGDILLNEGGDRDKLGRGWIWEGQLPTCIHQNHVFRARPASSDLQSKFISHYANHFGQAFFVDHGKQTTNLASVALSRVRRFPIALPPATEQAQVINEVSVRFGAVSSAAGSVEVGRARQLMLDRAILAKAFRGELVPQDPNDEPVVLPTDADGPAPAPSRSGRAPSKANRTQRKASR